jgi:aryl-alcohol dehydrogenase-like predicted oxidoreductase
MSDERGRAGLDRRDFLVSGGALAGSVLAGCAHQPARPPAAGTGQGQAPAAEARIREYRTLGRTGFKVSDIGFGCTRMIGDPEVVRYAYDRGVNLIDTAEGYGNGNAERTIGQALAHLPRQKIFIITKLKVKPDETEQSIVERLERCLERLKTDHVEALYMHAIADVGELKHAAYHAAMQRLRTAGKVKYSGFSCHGPRGAGDSVEKVCLAAVEDGRFDLILPIHSFINPLDKVLAACQAKQVGVTLMKTRAGRLKLEAFNPEAPENARLINNMEKAMGREAAVARVKDLHERHQAEVKEHRSTIDAFVAKHGIRSEEQLAQKSVQWALGSPAVASALISFSDFESVDAYLPVSGLKLAEADGQQLRDWAAAFGSQYCRHGCQACAAACPHGVPVSTVMRYAYYARQGAERHGMLKYAALAGADASRCIGCQAPCAGACPHGLSIQAQLVTAHQLLSVG